MNLDTITGALRAELRDALTTMRQACATVDDLERRLRVAVHERDTAASLVSRLQTAIEALLDEPIDLDLIDTGDTDDTEDATVLGPIPRTKFDPERARAAAAGAI